MSYQNDIFIDNCVMRLAQIAVAIRQSNDKLACQELDNDGDINRQEFDAYLQDISDNAY